MSMGARIDIARQALAAAETAVGMSVEVSGAAEQRSLPVPPGLERLLPRGVAQGSVVQVEGSTTVLLAMVQAAVGEDRWCALVGMPNLGWAAAASALNLQRVVAVPRPAPDIAGVLGALIDGFDVLMVGPCPGLSPADRRTLTSRLRQRGAVLLTDQAWFGAHVELTVRTAAWDGLGRGHGLLRGRQMLITSTGRGAPGGVRQVRVAAGRDGLREVADLVAMPGTTVRREMAPEAEQRVWAEVG